MYVVSDIYMWTVSVVKMLVFPKQKYVMWPSHDFAIQGYLRVTGHLAQNGLRTQMFSPISSKI